VDSRLSPLLDSGSFSEGDIFILVHFFGMRQNVSETARLCQAYGMLLIEDCAHTLPDPDSPDPMGSCGTFSLFSLRKLLPLSDGGVLLVNDSLIKDKYTDFPALKIKTRSFKRSFIMGLDRAAFILGWPNTFILKETLKKIIGGGGDVFNISVSDGLRREISSDTVDMLSGFDMKEVISVRRRNYAYLSKKLQSCSEIELPFADMPDGSVPQAFPVLHNDADYVCSTLRKRGIGAGKWPDLELPEGINWGDFKGSSKWVSSLILLPLHQDLNFSYLDKIVYHLRSLI
jgi:dTDP-4-amino-4,6-dideoxygalactose transaminase